MSTDGAGAYEASWFWPNALLALTLLVGFAVVSWCLWQAFQ